MRAHRLAAALLAIGALGCGSSQSTVVEEKSPADVKSNPTTPLTPMLAKAHLADAAAEAKKWRSDAFLFQVSGSMVTDEGKANSWAYAAFSPGAKSCLGMRFIRGRAVTQELGGPECESAEPLGDIIDSDQVIKIAKENGVTKKDVSMIATRRVRKGQAVWMVTEEGMRNAGDITMEIDAPTGKVLSTTRNP